MKFLQTFLFTCLCFSYSAVFSQVQQDSLLSLDFDKSIELFNDDKQEEAVAIWKNLLEVAPDSSKYFGMSANNLSYYYAEANDIEQVKYYYELILHSNLRDDEMTGDFMYPFANYRYKANQRVVGLLLNDEKYEEALQVLNEADEGKKAAYQAFINPTIII